MKERSQRPAAPNPAPPLILDPNWLPPDAFILAPKHVDGEQDQAAITRLSASELPLPPTPVIATHRHPHKALFPFTLKSNCPRLQSKKDGPWV